MNIMFDASTLILLAKVSLLRKICELYDVVITNSVKNEALKKEQQFDAKVIKELIVNNIIKLKNVKDNINMVKKEFNLDNGEAETILLAKKDNLPVATDDWMAIKACKILNIRFITALHFLLEAYENKILTKELALEKLSKLQVYGRYSVNIIRDIKQKIGG